MRIVKTLILILTVQLFYTNCMSMPKQDDVVKEGKMYLLGKIDPVINLEKFFDGLDPKDLWIRIIFHQNREGKMGTEGQIWNGYGYKQYGDYFLLQLPKEKNYMVYIGYTPIVNVGAKQLFLEFEPQFEVNFKKEDRFIYVGDLIFRHSEKGSTVNIRDNYTEAQNLYSHFLKNNKGDYIVPEKRFFTGGGEVAVSRTIVEYSVFWSPY